MKRAEHGRGTIRTVRNRAGEVVGYQALLPRELSQAPADVRRPERYQERLGRPLPHYEEARRLLDAAIIELEDRRFNPKFGLPMSVYIRQEIDAQRTQGLRDYGNEARAERAVSTAKSVDRRWLRKTPFYEHPAATIETAELQQWFDWLRDKAVGRKGKPLSPNFIGHVASLLTAALERSGVVPNPAIGLKLPSKSRPRVPYLDRGSLKRLMRADIELSDRVMMGCGMGAGLRVGELLAIEAGDVHLDLRDPHLVVRYGGPHHAPTKGKKVRRVELFEPGLGFWQLWMDRFYTGRVRVFAGERGGFQKAWPEKFQGWAESAGQSSMTSHIMRHTYAVAMLSGSWGYELVGLEFISKQLGHGYLQTTERYYGAFEAGTWSREVQRFTGRNPKGQGEPLTALSLLGIDAANDAAVSAPLAGVAQIALLRGALPDYGVSPRHPPKEDSTAEKPGLRVEIDATTHQLIIAKAREYLQAVQDRSAFAHSIGTELAELSLATEQASSEQEADSA